VHRKQLEHAWIPGNLEGGITGACLSCNRRITDGAKSMCRQWHLMSNSDLAVNDKSAK
jgi:hypothetical protein